MKDDKRAPDADDDDVLDRFGGRGFKDGRVHRAHHAASALDAVPYMTHHLRVSALNRGFQRGHSPAQVVYDSRINLAYSGLRHHCP